MTVGPARPPRLIREGSVGLLALSGVLIFTALLLWLRGYNFGARSYQLILEFFSVSGLQIGSPVRLRGIPIGRVTAIRPGTASAEVEVTIDPATTLIPRASKIESNQSGLISETTIDFTPLKAIPPGEVRAEPLDTHCDRSLILCNGDRLKGETGVSFDELIRLSLNFTKLYSDPAFLGNLTRAIRNTSTAAAALTDLTQDVSGLTQDVTRLTRSFQTELPTLSRTLRTEVIGLSTSAKGSLTGLSTSAAAVGKAATRADTALTEVQNLVKTNRATLVTTLDNLSQTSSGLRNAVNRLSPVLDRVEQGKLLDNLETFATNAAQASANLKELTNTAINPSTLVTLYELLDSARATFQNTQKLTSDLDELTGDPNFRRNIRDLINGLSQLVSSTQNLEKTVKVAETLMPLTQAQTAQPSLSQSTAQFSEAPAEWISNLQALEAMRSSLRFSPPSSSSSQAGDDSQFPPAQ